MSKLDVEIAQLTHAGQCTFPQRAMGYLGVGPGDLVAFILAENGVRMEKCVTHADRFPQRPTTEALQELVLVIGRDAPARGFPQQRLSKISTSICELCYD